MQGRMGCLFCNKKYAVYLLTYALKMKTHLSKYQGHAKPSISHEWKQYLHAILLGNLRLVQW